MSAPALYTRHLGLAINIASRFSIPGADHDDVRQEAYIGLWLACRAHDPEKGAFPAFAQTVVRQRLSAILRNALREKHAVLTNAERVVVREDGLEVEIVDEIARGRDALEVVIDREKLDRIAAAVKALPARQREALAAAVNERVEDMATHHTAYRARRAIKAAAA